MKEATISLNLTEDEALYLHDLLLVRHFLRTGTADDHLIGQNELVLYALENVREHDLRPETMKKISDRLRAEILTQSACIVPEDLVELAI